ncbi:MAG TPA: LysR family transcriptional regulator [Pseudolabrys sp.]|nr:LysR family transcriptional regulator [Pseudolabrys sp.]
MTNIPTDLLRTLVAVADLRSFTKAAISLGITQPAVSAQIKRLQFLLGGDLFDRSTQGVALTAYGDKIVASARRLLSINDDMVDMAGADARSEQIIRVGAPGDFVASVMSRTLVEFRERWPGVRFNVRMANYEPLIRDLRQGDLDLVVSLSAGPPIDARHHWPEEVAWIRGKDVEVDLARPIPLVSYGERSLNRFLAVTALKDAGLEWEDVFIGPSLLSLSGAVAVGLGVMAFARRRAMAFGFSPWDDAPLPRLGNLHCGVYIREGSDREPLEQLADAIAEVLRPEGAASIGLLDIFASSLDLTKVTPAA